MLQGEDGACGGSRAACTRSPARWAAIQQFPAALGFPLLSKKFTQSNWFVAQPVLPASPSHRPVLPRTLGNSPPPLGEGSAALTAMLAAERRASSAGMAGQELVSPGQSSSCARPHPALPLPAQAALTLPGHSGGMGAGRFGNSLRAETQRFEQLVGRSRPVPRQPRLWLGTASWLSAWLDYQPQRCPLDGKHLVRLAVRRGHLLLEEGRPRGTGTILNKLQL